MDVIPQLIKAIEAMGFEQVKCNQNTINFGFYTLGASYYLILKDGQIETNLSPCELRWLIWQLPEALMRKLSELLNLPLPTYIDAKPNKIGPATNKDITIIHELMLCYYTGRNNQQQQQITTWLEGHYDSAKLKALKNYFNKETKKQSQKLRSKVIYKNTH